MTWTALFATLTSGPTWSQSNVLEEITVTATKREESVQDIAVAVTALNGDFVELVALYGPNDHCSFFQVI